MKKEVFSITVFVFALTTCIDQNTRKKVNSSRVEKPDETSAKVIKIDSKQLLLDSFKSLLDREQ